MWKNIFLSFLTTLQLLFVNPKILLIANKVVYFTVEPALLDLLAASLCCL